MKLLTLRTLGECVIEVGDRKLAPSAPHLFAVLLYLGVERGREIPRSTLFELLFPGEPGSAAAHNLRQLLYRLRGMGAALDCSSASVRLDSTSVVDALERRLARPYHETSKEPATSCALLPDYEPPTAPFSQWLEGYRDSAQRALMRKLGDDLQAARRGANWGAVEALSSSLLTVDPFNETATLCLAESLARSGSKHRALSLLNQFEQDVGRSVNSLALPSRLLKRRISESSVLGSPESSEAPLVGRTQEMEMLADVWAQARAGRCIAVSVTGEKSIGKSRLAEEFLSLVRLDGTGSVIFSRRRAADQARPLSLFADVCKQMICMPGAAGCAPSRLSFLTRLTTAPEGFESLRAEQSEVEFSIAHVRRAIFELIECVAEERPLILAVDDARFLDEASRDLLAEIIQQRTIPHLLVLLVGDTDRTPSADTVHHRLKPLERSALATVAEHFMRRASWPIDDSLRDWCVGMATGNPGYLELLLQSARTTSGRQLPRDLLALVTERIMALSSHARHALQAISIFGAACDGDVIERLCGLGRSRLIEALDELEAASMTVTDRGSTSCRSALIEECTRASGSPASASVLHARAARYLERQCRGQAPSQSVAWRIASHWRDAGHTRNARHWERVCWHQSIAIGQPMVAAQGIRRALSDSTEPADRAALLDDLANALSAAMEVSALQDVLQDRTILCAQLDDGPSVLARLEYDTAEASLLNMDDPRPVRSKLRSFLGSDRLDTRRRIRAARILAIAADDSLDAVLAKEVYDANLTVEPPDLASALLHEQTKLIYNTTFGDRKVALNEIARLRALAKSVELSGDVIVTQMNVVLAGMVVDAKEIDLTDLELCFEECRAAQMNRMAIAIAGVLACYLRDLGNMHKAAEWISAAEPLTSKPGTNRISPNYLSCGVDVALWAGDFNGARAYIDALVKCSPRYATGLVKNLWYLNNVRFAQFASKEPTPLHDVEQLLECHKLACSFGRFDDYVEVLWVALVSNGERRQASSLLREYLTRWRRERRPCNYFLKLRTETDPIWDRVRIPPEGGYVPA